MKRVFLLIHNWENILAHLVVRISQLLAYGIESDKSFS